MSHTKYIIQWKSKITGLKGQGEPMDKATAQAYLDSASKKFPEIKHKLVIAETES